MNTITATYQIVTPMFLGDAPQQTVEIRLPAMKGVLRFWWRALEWKNVPQDAKGDVSTALRCLHHEKQNYLVHLLMIKRASRGIFLGKLKSRRF